MKAREETSQRATESFSRRTGGDVSNKQPNNGEYPKATLAVLCSSRLSEMRVEALQQLTTALSGSRMYLPHAGHRDGTPQQIVWNSPTYGARTELGIGQPPGSSRITSFQECLRDKCQYKKSDLRNH